MLWRRVLFRPWFELLARVGSKGNAEIFLDAKKDTSPAFSSPVPVSERDGESLFVPERCGASSTADQPYILSE
jgi:hypothetical protein